MHFRYEIFWLIPYKCTKKHEDSLNAWCHKMISKNYLICLFYPMLAERVDVDEGIDVDEGSSKTDFDAVKTYIKPS